MICSQCKHDLPEDRFPLWHLGDGTHIRVTPCKACRQHNRSNPANARDAALRRYAQDPTHPACACCGMDYKELLCVWAGKEVRGSYASGKWNLRCAHGQHIPEAKVLCPRCAQRWAQFGECHHPQ